MKTEMKIDVEDNSSPEAIVTSGIFEAIRRVTHVDLALELDFNDSPDLRIWCQQKGKVFKLKIN